MADAGVTTEAFSALLSRDFKRSHELLASISKQLASTSRSRVDHNAAVVNLYSAGGPGSPDAQPHIRDLVLAAVHVLPESERPKSVYQFFSDTTKNRPALNTVLSACGGVHLYNLAVIAYNSDRIDAAAAIGEVLYTNVEAMEDWLALRSCFLLIDVYLRRGDITSASNAAVYAERIIPGFSNNSSAATGASSPTESARPTLFPVAPIWKGKTAAVLEPPVCFDDAKFCMHLYNARISAAIDSSKNLRKDAKSAVVAAEDAAGRPTAVALLVKTRLEPSVQKGLRILASIGAQTPEETRQKVLPIALNSLGVLHHRLGKHALAVHYFEQARKAFLKALETNTEAGQGWEGGSKDDDAVLSVSHAPQDTHVTYNLGLQYLQLEKYREALAMFSICARVDEVLASNSPHLWIRMAECCIAEGHTLREESQGVSMLGRGRGRRLVLSTKPCADLPLFQYAAVCARAAMAILDQKQTAVQEARRADNGSGAKNSDNMESETKQYAQMRSIALALLAYASLEFDAAAALSACNELVTVSSTVDPERDVLGRLYGAEALCILGRPDDAVERLAPLLAMRTLAHSAIRDGAFVNVALTHSMRGDMSTAVRAAKAALKVTGGQEKKETPRREALLVSAYVFLREGDLDGARNALHQLRQRNYS